MSGDDPGSVDGNGSRANLGLQQQRQDAMSQTIEGIEVRSLGAAASKPDLSRMPAYVEPPRPPAPPPVTASLAPFVVLGGIAAATGLSLWLHFAPNRSRAIAPPVPQPQVFPRPDPQTAMRQPPMLQDVPLPKPIAVPPPPAQAHHVTPTRKAHPTPAADAAPQVQLNRGLRTRPPPG